MLNIEETTKRQHKLDEIIRRLSEHCCTNDEIKENTKTLECLYNGGFRHQYSHFFPLLVDMEEEQKEYVIDFLLDNLKEICKYIETLNNDGHLDNLYCSILKLTDHLNLEYARYCTSISNQEQIKDLEKQNERTTKALQKANKDLNCSNKEFKHIIRPQLKNATKKLNSVQTELIAVLSIFSAIVVTFSGSMSFIGGALQGMEKAPFAKSIFFISLCGFVLFNLVYLMMYLVAKITERNIYARCKTPDCSCKSTCWGINKIRKRLPYVFWTNVALLIILFFSFCANIVPTCINNIIFFF